MNLHHRHASSLFSGRPERKLDSRKRRKSSIQLVETIKKRKQKVKQQTVAKKARHTTLMAHKICGIFATSSFHFGPPTDFISHYCSAGHYMLCSIEDFFFKVEHSCLTTGVHGIDTMFMFC